MPKILFISHCVPPVPFGPSFVLQKLFKHLPQDSYVVYTTCSDKSANHAPPKLPCKYYYAPAHSIYVDYTLWVSIREWLEILPMVKEGIKIVREEKISSILVYPTAGNCLLTAYLISKICRIPFSIYMLDLFSAVQTYRLRRLFSVLFEQTAMRSARTVFVMSETLQDYYLNKYGINSILLPHPCDTERYQQPFEDNGAVSDSKKRIVFTGMIYEAQLDSLLNLVQAIKEMTDIEFHIYSQRTPRKLMELGISGQNVVHHGFVDQESLAQIQRQADILFLPMAFNSPYPDLIKTASPSKLPEYLASGRPIIVHAPPYSYITWYATRYGWGEVVDKPDINTLKQAVQTLLHNKRRCSLLVENALKTLKRHDSARVANTLIKNLDISL